MSAASVARRLAKVDAERATAAAAAARAACDQWCETLEAISPTSEEWAANDAKHPPELRQMGALIVAATGVLYDRQATAEDLHRALVPLTPYLVDDETGEAIAGAADWVILEGIARFYEDDRERALAWAVTRGKGGEGDHHAADRQTRRAVAGGRPRRLPDLPPGRPPGRAPLPALAGAGSRGDAI